MLKIQDSPRTVVDPNSEQCKVYMNLLSSKYSVENMKVFNGQWSESEHQMLVMLLQTMLHSMTTALVL